MPDIDLSNYTHDQLLEIGNLLNSWMWHPLLGEPPKYFYRMVDYRYPGPLGRILPFLRSLRNGFFQLFLPSKHDVIHPIIEEVEKIVGKKAMLRYHWLNNLHKTEEEFEKWYYTECKEFYDWNYAKYGGDFFKFEP